VKNSTSSISSKLAPKNAFEVSNNYSLSWYNPLDSNYIFLGILQHQPQWHFKLLSHQILVVDSNP
jgi:hypothetical protein